MKKFATILLIVASIFVLASCSPAAISTKLILASGDGEAVSETASALLADGAKAYVKNSSGSYEEITSKTLDYGTLTVVDTKITGSSQASWKFTYTGKAGKTGVEDTLTVEIGVLNSDGASFKTKCATVTVNAAAVWSGEVSESVALSNKAKETTKTLVAAGSKIYIDSTEAASTEVKDASGNKVGVLSVALSSDKKSVTFSFSDGLQENDADATAKAVKVLVKDTAGVTVGTYEVTCKHVGTPITKGEVTLEVTNRYTESVKSFELGSKTYSYSDNSFSNLYVKNLDGLNYQAVIDGLTVIYGDEDAEENVLNYNAYTDGSGNQIIAYYIPVEINGDVYGTLFVIPLFTTTAIGYNPIATGYVKVGLINENDYLLPYNWVTKKLRVGVYTDIESELKTVAHDTDFEELNLTCIFDYATVELRKATSCVINLVDSNFTRRASALNPSWTVQAYAKGSSDPIDEEGVEIKTGTGTVVGTLVRDGNCIKYEPKDADKCFDPIEGNLFVEIWAVSGDATYGYTKQQYKAGELNVIAINGVYDKEYALTLNAKLGVDGSVNAGTLTSTEYWDATNSKWVVFDADNPFVITLADGQKASFGRTGSKFTLSVNDSDKSSTVVYVRNTDSKGTVTRYKVTCNNVGLGGGGGGEIEEYTVTVLGTYAPTDPDALSEEVKLEKIAKKDVTRLEGSVDGVSYTYEFKFIDKYGNWSTNWIPINYNEAATANKSEQFFVKADGTKDTALFTLTGLTGAKDSTTKDITWKCTLGIPANAASHDTQETGTVALLVRIKKTVTPKEAGSTAKETYEYVAYGFEGTREYKASN